MSRVPKPVAEPPSLDGLLDLKVTSLAGVKLRDRILGSTIQMVLALRFLPDGSVGSMGPA